MVSRRVSPLRRAVFSGEAPPPRLLTLRLFGDCCATATFFLALPRAVLPQRVANLREHKVSGTSSGAGETLTNMRALESPLRESWRKKVSLELRKGTCFLCSEDSEWMTSPRLESDLLMFWVSRSMSGAVASVFARRSEPARSTRCSFEDHVKPSALLRVTCSVTTWWLRLDWAFTSWLPTARCAAPSAMSASTSAAERTGRFRTPGTSHLPDATRMSSFFFVVLLLWSAASRSRSVSL
mmetsp:Transcript_17112/g.51981  ORF Transcript_17112/g.51981 Transcript_17112/m.51981 type:complete len:239 (-) Transcript_17112:353-1069(-)